MKDNIKPFSIIIPTCNRDKLLNSTLASIKSQSSDIVNEIIIVSDGDKLPVISDKAKYDIKLIDTGGGKGPAYARNLGANIATGRILVFIDDDIQLVPSALDIMYKNYSDINGAGAVAGHIIPAPSLQQNVYIKFAYGGAVHTGSTSSIRREYLHYCTSFAAVERELFIESGGFDERFKLPGYEDVELAFRIFKLNKPLTFSDNAIAYHFKQMDREWFINRCKRTGAALYLFHEIQPEARQWYHKYLFNSLNMFVARILSRLMLKHIEKIEKLPFGSNVRGLKTAHAFSVMAAYSF